METGESGADEMSNVIPFRRKNTENIVFDFSKPISIEILWSIPVTVDGKEMVKDVKKLRWIDGRCAIVEDIRESYTVRFYVDNDDQKSLFTKIKEWLFK